MARIISIVNQKGGTGKSACTANLAVGLAQKNMKVLIVDADPQSDVSAGFGYRDCDDSNETLLRNVYGSQIHIFDNYIPFSVRMKEAVREGQSIFSYDPKGKATEAYRRVTEEVLKDAI